MLHEVFYWILNMSIIGGLIGLLVLIIRRIPRLPHGFVYALWLIPAFRLLTPLGISSRYSVMTLLSRFTTRTVEVRLPGFPSDTSFSMTNAVMAAEDYFPITYKTDTLDAVFSWASRIWLVIAAALFIAMLILYFLARAEIKGAVHVEGNLYRSDRITAPAVYGVFRPKIILPEQVNDDALPYILLHERAHIKRRDNLLRVFALMIACLHWFNPLAWVMLGRFFEDMELSCDARVMKGLGEDEGKRYALSIVDAAYTKSMLVSAFGGAKIKVRVENILSYRRLTAVSGFCFVALFAAVLYVLLTGAQV